MTFARETLDIWGLTTWTLRWDRANVHAFNGRYGDYLLAKVSQVFPQLRDEVL